MTQDVSSLGQMVPVERLQAVNRLSRQTADPQTPGTSSLTPTLNHKVQAGETLSGIAQKYLANKPADMDLETWITTIQVTNGLADRNAIKVGQVLSIPQLVTHGETLQVTTSTAPTPYDPEAGLTFSGTPATPATAGGNAAQPPQPVQPDWTEKVLGAASDSLGTRYKWGGTDLKKGIDCSGLTQQVFDQVGVDLPRTSAEQFKAGGQPVQRADLQPGDLIFFRNTKGKICHVGIYSGTDDKGRQVYISATTSKGVAEVAIDDWTRWNKTQRYAGAKRFAAPATP